MNRLDRSRFEQAITFDQFLDAAEANAELWRATDKRVAIEPGTVERAASIPGRWNILVMADDWCGDAVNSVPHIARLAEQVPGWELRVIGRDANPDLMDSHLTNGSRSIPVVMLLDEELNECAWWGPRPAELQEWVMESGMAMPKEERYREVRRWYARDRGRTTIDELLTLMESVVATCRAAA